jgi:hypothetical protein
VAGTLKATDAFWREKCKEVPAGAAYLVLTMTPGDVVDYFKPVDGADWCEMLTSKTKHQWSEDGIVWITPGYYDSSDVHWGATGVNGGSAQDWPHDTLEGDQRAFLTSWGTDYWGNGKTGACCSNSTSESTVDLNGEAFSFWGHAFTFAYQITGTTTTTATTTTTTPVLTKGEACGCTSYRFGAKPTDEILCWSILTSEDGSVWCFPPTNGICNADGIHSYQYCGAATEVQPTGKTKVPPPSNYAIVPLVDADGQINLDDTFWAAECQKIPADAAFVMLDMGGVRDYFRPVDGTTWCQMLATDKQHQWSDDGISWSTPTYVDPDFYSYFRGGSSPNWPELNVDGDQRQYLSIWGAESDNATEFKGGCCSSTYEELRTFPTANQDGWGQPFAMSFGAPHACGGINRQTIVYNHTDVYNHTCGCKHPTAEAAVPLTRAMTERNDADELKTATCIPRHEFYGYADKLTLSSLPALIHIASGAFMATPHPDNVIDLSDSVALESIEDLAFTSFSGSPFKGMIRMVGKFPALRLIGSFAFQGAVNVASMIEIKCASPDGLEIQSFAFGGFAGTHNDDGECCSCDEFDASTCAKCVATTTTTAPTTTSTTTTSITSTSTARAAAKATSTTSTTATSITSTSTTRAAAKVTGVAPPPDGVTPIPTSRMAPPSTTSFVETVETTAPVADANSTARKHADNNTPQGAASDGSKSGGSVAGIVVGVVLVLLLVLGGGTYYYLKIYKQRTEHAGQKNNGKVNVIINQSYNAANGWQGDDHAMSSRPLNFVRGSSVKGNRTLENSYAATSNQNKTSNTPANKPGATAANDTYFDADPVPADNQDYSVPAGYVSEGVAGNGDTGGYAAPGEAAPSTEDVDPRYSGYEAPGGGDAVVEIADGEHPEVALVANPMYASANPTAVALSRNPLYAKGGNEAGGADYAEIPVYENDNTLFGQEPADKAVAAQGDFC